MYFHNNGYATMNNYYQKVGVNTLKKKQYSISRISVKDVQGEVSQTKNNRAPGPRTGWNAT